MVEPRLPGFEKSESYATRQSREWRRKKAAEDPGFWMKKASAYRKAHPEKVAAWKHAYYLRHKAECNRKTKERRDRMSESERDRVRAKNREYQRQRVKLLSNLHRHKRYGLTLGAIDAMLEAQDHRCAICRGGSPKRPKLCVDHCHSTRTVRGILCDRCNLGLGAFADNPAFLQAAIAYLAAAAVSSSVSGPPFGRIAS